MPAGSFTYAWASVSDLPVLAEHRRRMYVDMGILQEGGDDPSSAAYDAWLRTRLMTGEARAVVVRREGEAVASATMWWQPVQPRPQNPVERQPYIVAVYVDKAARHHGIAHELVRRLVDEAVGRGARWVALHSSHEAIHVYEGLGFRHTDEMRYMADGHARPPAAGGAR